MIINVILCTILQDGRGDLGNMLSFLQAIKPGATSQHFVVILLFLKAQRAMVEQMCNALQDTHIQFLFLESPTERDAYRQNDFSHYDIPAPGKPKVPAEVRTWCNQANRIFVFPVVYPFLSHVIGENHHKVTQFLEYGRSLESGLPSHYIPMGVKPHEQGILFHRRSRFFAPEKKMDPILSSHLLAHSSSWKHYLRTHALTVAYFKPTPTDEAVSHFKQFLILAVLMTKQSAETLDLVYSRKVASLEPFFPFLYEFGIAAVQLITPEKTSPMQSISLEHMPSAIQTILKKKPVPQKTLRLFMGFSMRQDAFLALLALSAKSAWPDHCLPMGACGDGSTTDVLSLAHFLKKTTLIPIIQPVTTYQHETVAALSDIADTLLTDRQHTCLLQTLSFDTRSPTDVVTLAAGLKHTPERAVFHRFFDYLYKNKNIVTYLKKKKIL